jgi:hypothetical protein
MAVNRGNPCRGYGQRTGDHLHAATRNTWADFRQPKSESLRKRPFYESALDSLREEALKSDTPIQDEQYSVMRYLAKTLKGLSFNEL